MSYEVRKQQRQRKRKISNIIIISIFLLVMAKTAYGIIVKNPKTILAKEEQYIVSFMSQSVLIKDEKVYDIDGNIEFNPNIEEGKRVSKGYEVGKVNIVQNIGSLNEELEEINTAIDLLNKKNEESEVFSTDKDSLEITQGSLIEEIKKKINEKDYSGISELKNHILISDEKLRDVSMDKTLLGISLENLGSRRDSIIYEINSNSIKYYTQEAGVISFKIDEYENIYVPKEFDNYTYDRIEIPEVKNNIITQNEDKVLNKYKIINNFDWYLAIKIDNIKDVSSYELNNSIYLKVADIDRELVGNIIAINYTKDKAILIVKFNSYLHDYYDLRFPNVEVFLERQDVFLIPTKSITENDGQKGVYIKEFNGIVRFRPVEILEEKDDQTLISKGDENRFINLSLDKPVRTISLYDEILINPNNFNEGEILN